MYGLECTRCLRPLTFPFRSVSFTNDGAEQELVNKRPEPELDAIAVTLYFHKDCSKQGKYSAKILRRKAKEDAKRELELRRKMRRAYGGAWHSKTALHLVAQGWHVTLSQKKIVRVLPPTKSAVE